MESPCFHTLGNNYYQHATVWKVLNVVLLPGNIYGQKPHKKRGCIYEFFPFFKTCALSWKNGCIYRYAHFLTFKDNTRCILHIDVGQFTLVLALDIFYFSVVSCLIYKILKDISFVCCDNIVNFCLVKIFNLIFIF